MAGHCLRRDKNPMARSSRPTSADSSRSTTLADVLVGYGDRPPMLEAVYETHIENLDIAPSHIRIAMLERAVQIEEQYRLKDSLERLAEYDFVVIDCPPSLGMTLTQALIASSHVIVPVAAPAGTVTVICVVLSTLKFPSPAEVPSNETSVAPWKPEPGFARREIPPPPPAPAAQEHPIDKAREKFGKAFPVFPLPHEIDALEQGTFKPGAPPPRRRK